MLPMPQKRGERSMQYHALAESTFRSRIVVPENSMGIEIIALVGVGFTGHVLDLPFIPAIFRAYFQSRADLQVEILPCDTRFLCFSERIPSLN